MKKLVVFTTAILAALIIVLCVFLLGNHGFNLGAVKEKQTQESAAVESEPDYYVGDLLRLRNQEEMVTYEGRDFTVDFTNPFYDETSTDYISVIFYDEDHGFLLQSIGTGDDSEFFNTYRTEDGCQSWTQCAGTLWFSVNGDNYLQMISENELIYISKSENATYGTTSTTISYSPDFGDTWTELSDKSAEGVSSDEIIEAVESMSIEQKVAMMFMLTPEELTGSDQILYAGDTTRSLLETYPVSGLIYSSTNIDYDSQLRNMIESTQTYATEISGYSMFLAVDEEGGDVTVLTANETLGTEETTVSSAAAIGRGGDASAALTAGKTIGSLLSDYGFNMDLAPVADVLGGNSHQMGSRVYNTDAQTVSDMVLQMMEGLSEENVLSVMKYFPGYGAAYDTTDGFPVNNSSLDDLMSKEFVPYINAIENGVSFIQVGHISVPEITGDDTPASLSSKVIEDVLRDKLGYEGIVMTDRLDDEAVQAKYTSAKAAVKAVKAGADILVCPADFEEAYNAIIKAVKKGTITEERINQSAYRILSVRASLSSSSDTE